jgi:hypothetical protein
VKLEHNGVHLTAAAGNYDAIRRYAGGTRRLPADTAFSSKACAFLTICCIIATASDGAHQ